jgi:hypothetical protein
MYKYLPKHSFTLKLNKRSSQFKCDKIHFTTAFYGNLILHQKESLRKLLEKSKKFKYHLNFDFLFKSDYLNKRIFQDTNIENMLINHLVENLASPIRSKSTYYYLVSEFLKSLQNNPDHPLTKGIIKNIENNYHLFSGEEKKVLIEQIIKKTKEKNENKSKKSEKKDQESDEDENENLDDDFLMLKKFNLKPEDLKVNPGVSGNEYKSKYLDIQNQFLNLYIDESIVTISSKLFESKIKLIALNDNEANSVLQSLKIVEKFCPSIVLFQKRPIYNLNSNSPLGKATYLSDKEIKTKTHNAILDKELIQTYCKEYLKNNSNFQTNKNEKLVYENVGSFKTLSYVQSLILKYSYNLNTNHNIKIILADLPIFKEIEHMVRNIFNPKLSKRYFHPFDFFSFCKMSYLFEKFHWLVDTCSEACPACDKRYSFTNSHMTMENILHDYLLSLEGNENVKVQNISKQIMRAIKINNYENNCVVAFVNEDNLFHVTERLVKDLNELTFTNIDGFMSDKNQDEFDFPLGDINGLIDEFEDKNEIYNKLALVMNFYENPLSIPEIENIKDSHKGVIADLYKIYNEKLNFVDDIRQWPGKKYDYKCFPTEMLINKYLQ